MVTYFYISTISISKNRFDVCPKTDPKNGTIAVSHKSPPISEHFSTRLCKEAFQLINIPDDDVGFLNMHERFVLAAFYTFTVIFLFLLYDFFIDPEISFYATP